MEPRHIAAAAICPASAAVSAGTTAQGAAAVGREKTAMGTAGFGAGTPGVLHLIFQF